MRRRVYRGVLASIVLSSALFLAGTTLAAEPPFATFQEQSETPVAERTQLAPPRDGITVVTSHVGAAGDIVALRPNGTLLYHDGTHDGYWDVDPSPAEETTVVYSATDEVRNASLCDPVGNENHCVRQLIEQANLTTGETTVLYSRIDPRYRASEWHDVDRINGTHYLVADMYSDEVFVVNVSSGIVTWEWSLQNHLPLSTGGPYPDDWAHLNDVEPLEDGRIMVSLRNQDMVVFVDRSEGVQEEWTLGEDDRHGVLFEQHNPDYIPRSDGGPAVVVAGSENNRIVEYQRTQDGDWTRTWVWRDRRLQWPRDADRLPNGHTLITDTHGGRVIEVDRQGEVVWRFDVPTAYEAERLNTGDESAGGPSARRAELTSRTGSDERSGVASRVKEFIKALFPNKVVNGIASTTPTWMGFYDLVVLSVGASTAILWLVLEIRWSTLTFRSPVTRG